MEKVIVHDQENVCTQIRKEKNAFSIQNVLYLFILCNP